jgi:hypothetical protein
MPARIRLAYLSTERDVTGHPGHDGCRFRPRRRRQPGLLIGALVVAAATPQSWFEDVTARTGVDFVLRNAASPQKHQIETMLGGIALLDFDNDGRLDIFFANGAHQPSLSKTEPGFSNRLYRNAGGWKFTGVTEQAGLRGQGYSMGAAAADYDNDGHTDLLVTGVKGSRLYHNRGDGTFEDITEKAGLGGATLWSIAGAWFDYDRDGDLDLFIAQYVHWNPGTEPFCGDPAKTYRTYCHPKFYQGLPNLLFRNNGNGRFQDVSNESGISAHIGKGMGVAIADYDADGLPDVFVANDTVPNFLFRNEGNGKFRESGLAAGVAFNDDGRALSSMGVDFRDIDNDGRPDLFVTALINETYPLFRNLGRGLFADITYPSRIGAATMAFSGWGAGAFDFDNDGFKDLVAANGDVQDNTEVYSSRKSRQQNLLLANQGDGTFSARAFGNPGLYRGAAFGDLDGDGRIDAVMTRLQEPVAIYRNTAGEGRHWLALRLRGSKSNRDAIGARVSITTPSGRTQYNHVTTSVGYASSSDKAVHFGLGSESRVKAIEIAWPSGTVQKLQDVSADRYLDVEEP